MATTVQIRFRVDAGQYDKIKSDLSRQGFKTVASYFRYLAFERDLRYETMIYEIYNILKRQES